MPNSDLIERSGLEDLLQTARQSSLTSDAGVSLFARRGMGIATVMARKGMREALARDVKTAYGLSLPGPRERSTSGSIAFAWAAPDQWLATAEAIDRSEFEASLRGELSESSCISNQSDGRTVIRVSGPKVRGMLAKGVPLDLHPNVFKPGDSAVTTVAHIGVHMWQLDDMPTYEFAVFRSFAAAFWTFLVESSKEFGFTVTEQA